jgi:hypothetical protein
MTAPQPPYSAEQLQAVAATILGDGSSTALLQRVAAAIAAVHAYPLAPETEPALIPAQLPAEASAERSRA